MTKRPPNLIKKIGFFRAGEASWQPHSSVWILTALDERAVQIRQLQSEEFQAEVNEPEQPSARTTLLIMDLNNSGLE